MDYEQLANAALIFVTGILGYFGIRKGLRTPDRPADGPELRLGMAMIDNRAVDRLAGSVEALNMTVTETNKLISHEIQDREIEEEVERRLKERGH